MLGVVEGTIGWAAAVRLLESSRAEALSARYRCGGGRHHPKPARALAAHKHGLALALAARAMAAPAPLGDDAGDPPLASIPKPKVAKIKAYLDEVRRYNYVTPTSYLELINCIKQVRGGRASGPCGPREERREWAERGRGLSLRAPGPTLPRDAFRPRDAWRRQRHTRSTLDGGRSLGR